MTAGETQAPGRALHDWFMCGLAAAPDGDALRIGDRSWTYAQLHEMALSWAGPCRLHRLCDSGRWEFWPLSHLSATSESSLPHAPVLWPFRSARRFLPSVPPLWLRRRPWMHS